MPPTIAAVYRPATIAPGHRPERRGFSRTRLPRPHLDHGPCTRRRRQFMPPTRSGNHDGRTQSHHPRLSNPHRSSAPHGWSPSGPRFLPLRLIRRLPSEPAARSVFGRHLITLNKGRSSRPADDRPFGNQDRTRAGRVGSSQKCQFRPLGAAHMQESAQRSDLTSWRTDLRNPGPRHRRPERVMLTSLQDRNLNAVEIGWPFRLGLQGCIVDRSQDIDWQSIRKDIAPFAVTWRYIPSRSVTL